MGYTLDYIAQQVQGKVHGDTAKQVNTLASLAQAKSDDISFVNGEKYLSQAKASQAGVLIVSSDLVDELKSQCALIEVASPYLAFAMLTHLFAPKTTFTGIAETAKIHPTAKIGQNVTIGEYVVIGEHVTVADHCVIYPHSFIAERVNIGERTFIESHVSILADTQIGQDVRIHANTSIGGEGFGFAPYQGKWHRIAQLGKVRIGNRVRIGSNCSIDRGALDDTIIEDGVIIDNLVQIAHNVHIGENTAIAAKTGIAGSTVIGKNCIIAGACGIAGHIHIADNVQLSGMSMVTKSIEQAGTYSSGTGLLDSASWRKAVVSFRQLVNTPIMSITKQINQLQQRLDELERK